METAELDIDIERAFSRAEAIRARVQHRPWQEGMPLEMALEELGQSLGELRRAEDEIRRLRREAADERGRAARTEMNLRRALEASEARSSSVFDAALDGIVTVDGTGVITAFNQAAERIFGYGAAEVLGAVFTELLDSRYRNEDTLEHLCERARAEAEHELDGMRKDGVVVPLRVSLATCAHGESRTYVAIIRDLSAQERFEQQRSNAQKMEAIGRLAGGIAHDFNNLLLIIMGRSEFLLERMEREDGNRKHAREIRKAGKRAAALTRQLLAFSRQQARKPRLVDLNSVIKGIREMLWLVIAEDIQLDLRLSPNVGGVRVDPGQIEQVVMNLVVNARDAMPDGGHLIIETSSRVVPGDGLPDEPECDPGAYVVLSVADTGQGMDEATRARIFEPYFTTKGEGEGTGLGLATVYGIVKQSGGHIAVRSEAGRGTAFDIHLPRVGGQPEDVDQEPARRRDRDASGRILLVEDNTGARTALADFLEEEGFEVVAAATADEALVAADEREGDIDLVIADMVLPGTNGFELVKELRRRAPHIKALFMSGYNRSEMLSGVEVESAFLQKPFRVAELCDRARSLIS